MGSQEEGRGQATHTVRLRVATLNVKDLMRQAECFAHSFGLVKAMMEDEGTDVMILTGMEVAYRRRRAAATEAKNAGLCCRLATPPDGVDAGDSGVMVVWRLELGMLPAKTVCHEGGRGVAIRFRQAVGGHEWLMVVGIHGVSNPGANQAAADELWAWTSGQVSRSRTRARSKGHCIAIMVGGDANAVMDPTRERGVVAALPWEDADEGLAGFLRGTSHWDAAECMGVKVESGQPGQRQTRARALRRFAEHLSSLHSSLHSTPPRIGSTRRGAQSRSEGHIYVDPCVVVRENNTAQKEKGKSKGSVAPPGDPPAVDVEDISDNTSLVTVLSSAHGRKRREERDITKRDLKAAVKYGKKEPATMGRGTDRWKYTFAGVVYITDSESKVEITSWPEDVCGFDVPLIRITDAMAAEHDTAVADLRNQGSWTSHTVIVVDQSGSMRRADVEGEATRAEAVWLTLAFTCVGDELRSGNRTASDVISIIGMRNTGELLVDCEPMDWLLYNKIVGFLRNERPSGDGMYADSIELAEACLLRNTRGNCALALFFLSDGKPSDERERWNLTSEQRAWQVDCGVGRTHAEEVRDRDNKLGSRIGKLASRFGRRLTVGTIGFADPSENFSALKILTAECAAYDCQASFHAPALTAHSLKQVLTSLSSTLTATKTEMTAVGGSSQRTVRNVLRESKTGVVDDMYANEDNWWIYDGQAGNSVVARMTWDSKKAYATRGKHPWRRHRMYLHENADGVAMRNKIFGEGAERMVSKFREFNFRWEFVGPWMVAKESRFAEETGGHIHDHRLFHSTFCKTQQKADRIAQEFNLRLTTIPGVNSSTPRIRFLDCHVYILHDEGEGRVGVLVEKMLDVSRYKKWNTNNGGVDGMPSMWLRRGGAGSQDWRIA